MEIWTQGLTRSGAYWMSMSGALLLGYGLVRDLYTKQSCPRLSSLPTQKLRAVCLESLLGLSGVFLGLALQFLQWTPLVHLSWGALGLLAGAILLFGYLTRHWILVLVRVEDHRQIRPAVRPE